MASPKPTPKPDVVAELPGAPATPDEPITFEAPWHNAEGTGRYTEPDVAPVTAYHKPDADGPLVAKVVEAPARPVPHGGRQAETKDRPKASKSKAAAPEDPAAAEQPAPAESS